MRPGANAGINPSGNSAPDYGLASMMPDANRRDHKRYSAATFPWDQLGFNEARRCAPGSLRRSNGRNRRSGGSFNEADVDHPFNEARREAPGLT